MKQRYNLPDTDSEGFSELLKLESFMDKIEWLIPYRYLIKVRASLLNKCAYCLNMHSKEALEKGVSSEKLNTLKDWKHSVIFDELEKTILKFTDHFTLVSQHEFDEELFQKGRKYFDNKQIAQIVMAIGMINLWNRVVISSGIE